MLNLLMNGPGWHETIGTTVELAVLMEATYLEALNVIFWDRIIIPVLLTECWWVILGAAL